MTKRNIGREILDGIEEAKAWRRGEVTLRSTEIALPVAADVAGIRKQLALSQDAFAAFLGVSVGTVRGWEQGRREPQGPARVLLVVAGRQPVAFKKALATVRKDALTSADAA